MDAGRCEIIGNVAIIVEWHLQERIKEETQNSITEIGSDIREAFIKIEIPKNPIFHQNDISYIKEKQDYFFEHITKKL